MDNIGLRVALLSLKDAKFGNWIKNRFKRINEYFTTGKVYACMEGDWYHNRQHWRCDGQSVTPCND